MFTTPPRIRERRSYNGVLHDVNHTMCTLRSLHHPFHKQWRYWWNIFDRLGTPHYWTHLSLLNTNAPSGIAPHVFRFIGDMDDSDLIIVWMGCIRPSVLSWINAKDLCSPNSCLDWNANPLLWLACDASDARLSGLKFKDFTVIVNLAMYGVGGVIIEYFQHASLGLTALKMFKECCSHLQNTDPSHRMYGKFQGIQP